MSFSLLPLSYCTNVHPGRSLAEVAAGLTNYTLPIRAAYARPLAAGLWLARPVVDELLVGNHLAEFAGSLRRQDLPCYTLNAFPYGDFHSERVKEQVYLPDWTSPLRQRYTVDCARVLAELLAEETEGSISTVPLGFKPLSDRPDFLDECCQLLTLTAQDLARLREETGRCIRLAIEPEPLCVLETTPETVAFFHRLREHAAEAGLVEAVQEHIGVCYDVCHQSVEFEDVVDSIQTLQSAGIRINKLHISCAIEAPMIPHRRDVREALHRYVEPRYLHQTFARRPDGGIGRCPDLDAGTIENPSIDLAEAPLWRVHFHVPVDAEQLGPLTTTRPDLVRALRAIRELPYAPHLEVETYTWEVLPGGGPPQLVPGLSRELTATLRLLQDLSNESSPR